MHPHLVALAAAAAALAAEKAPERIWSGKSGGFAIEWTTADLVARDAKGALAFSAGERAAKFLADFGDECSATQSYELVSAVGRVLSLKVESGADCQGAAHPTAHSAFVAVDLAQPEKDVALPAL